MAEAPAVALLFEDVALGEQLRDALRERGARIVHEGSAADLTRQQLIDADADVLVVNLDNDDDATLDRLYEAIDGDRPRVVFNDPQASGKLEGWDRARWARHLAMKVLVMGEIDPPRPHDARPLDALAVDTSATTSEDAAPSADGYEEFEHDPQHQQVVAASETLATELEALLAAEPEVDVGGSKVFWADANDAGSVELDEFESSGSNSATSNADVRVSASSQVAAPASPDFNALSVDNAFLENESVDEDQPGDLVDQKAPKWSDVSVGDGGTHPSGVSDAPGADAFDDELELVPAEFSSSDSHSPSPAAAEPFLPNEEMPATAAQRASDGWSLLDDAAAAPLPEVVALSVGSFQRMAASEYLAPDAGDHTASPVLPGLSLELESMEQALAPEQIESAHEMVLDELAGKLHRVVLLGATTEGTNSVCDFLAALPNGLSAVVLHTQHLAGKPADELVEYLAAHCAMPVLLAEHGARARHGEVLVVPSDRQVHLRPDGGIELLPIKNRAKHTPSIDISFTMAANGFGRDALAIVFAGRSTDAVGGCQAIHDRGGRVWVETCDEHFADMVSGIVVERLAQFSGTPQQLAAHLIEELSMEGHS